MDGKRISSQCLRHEIWNDATVPRVHSWTIGIEQPRNANFRVVLAMEIVTQRLCNTLAFVITGTRSDTIYGPDIVFWLGVNIRIAIDFACRCLEQTRTAQLAKLQGVQRSDKIGAQCSDAIAPILAGRARTSKVVDPVDGNIGQPFAYVALDKVESGVRHGGSEISLGARPKIVKTPHFMAKLQ